jgi:hypothetical protein
MLATLIDEGIEVLAQVIAGQTGHIKLTLRWSTYAGTPSSSDTLSTYPQATDGGLADIILTLANWTFAVAAGVVTATYPPYLATAAGGATETEASVVVYDQGSGKAVFAIQLISPWVNPLAGQQYYVNPTFQFGNV